MSRTITCENFMERLEGMAADAMPGEELIRLEKHAENCPDCAMLLRLRVHLTRESLADLEARVPDKLVANIWSRLTAEMTGCNRVPENDTLSNSWRSRLDSLLQTWPRPAPRWLVPALAAGIMILLFGGGYLLGEVNQLKQRERLLITNLLQQEQLASTRVGTRPTWWSLPRAHPREEDLTVAQLVNLLTRMPPQAVILDAGAIQAGRWQRPYQRELLRTAATVGVPMEDGLQAAEALQILEVLDLNPEQTFSMTRLLVLATGQTPGDLSRAGRRVRLLGED